MLQCLLISTLIASFCVLGINCQNAKDLLENVDVAAALAGQVEDINIRTVNVDLSILSALADSELTSRLSEAIEVSGSEADNSLPTRRVFADTSSPAIPDVPEIPDINSQEITRLANELSKKLLAGTTSMTPGIYQTGTEEDTVLMQDKNYDAPVAPTLSFSEEDVEAMVSEIVELAAPGTNTSTENINVIIVNCDGANCDTDALSALSDENLVENVISQLTRLSPAASPSNLEAPEIPAIPQVSTDVDISGDYDECNIVVVNVGDEMSPEAAISDMRSHLANRNMRCVAATCPRVVAEDANIQIGDCNRNANGVCEFACPEGMEVSGPEFITCRPDGAWDDQPPICVPIPCLTLEETDHMQINWDNCESIAGTSCVFGCEDGWELVGPESIDCSMDGQWSALPPSCREITCPSLTIANGTTTTCPETQRTTCAFECIQGYEMIGPSEIDCSIQGNWAADPPTCEEPVCEPLEDPVDGVVNCYGTTCAYTCNDGFHLHGESTLVCQPGGEWSGPPPICTQSEPLCAAPDAPTNGAISDCGQKVGETCTVTCNSPYKPVGAVNLECKLGARWSAEPARCVPADQVPDYFVGPEAMEAEDATKWCLDRSGRPLKITSQEQNDEIVDLLQNDFTDKMVWLGASDSASQGNWRWNDDALIAYDQWMDNQPAPNTPEKEYDCAAIWNRQEYQWVAVCCDELLYPMCEYAGQVNAM